MAPAAEPAPPAVVERLKQSIAAVVKDKKLPAFSIVLVDDRRVFWKSAVGLDRAWEERRGMPVAESFCRLVVASGEPLIVADAEGDDRTRGTGAIRSLGILAWAGHPIRSPEGHVLGVLCVGDGRPREWTAQHAAVRIASVLNQGWRVRLSSVARTGAPWKTTRWLSDARIPPARYHVRSTSTCSCRST